MTLKKAKATIAVKEDILDHIRFLIKYHTDSINECETRESLAKYEELALEQEKEELAVLKELEIEYSQF